MTYTGLPNDGVKAINALGTAIQNVATNFAGASASVPAAGPPAALDLNQHGLTGSWFEPVTSGQGVEVEIYPSLAGASTGVVQVSWFTFDTGAVGGPERQRWYTLGGTAAGGAAGQRWYTGQSGYVPGARTLAMTIFETTGGRFNAATTPPPGTAAVGTATLAFQSCSAGTLDYSFTGGSSAGATGRIALRRVGPVPPGCAM